MAAASVLSYRLPADEYLLNIELVVDNSQDLRNSNFVPGQVCRYIGPLTSLILEQSEYSEGTRIGPYMEVNQRDFIASLHRML